MWARQRLWTGVIVGVCVLVGVVLVLQHLLNADTYRGRIEATLSASLGRRVQLGHLAFSILSGSLVADSPTIADAPDFGSQPFVQAKDVRIGIKVLPLVMHRDLQITSVRIDQPTIVLLRRADGTWNFSNLGSQSRTSSAPSSNDPDPPPDLTVSKLQVRNGTVKIGSAPDIANTRSYTDVDVNATNFSLATSFPFTISGKLPGDGTLALDGTAGPIDTHEASLTPFTAHVSLKHADLVQAGIVEASQGVSGIADLTAEVTSKAGSMQATGGLQLSRLQLAKNGTPSARPVDIKFSIQNNLQTMTQKIDPATVQIGNAILHLAGTLAKHGKTTDVQMHVTGDGMPVDDLVAFLPSAGVQLPAGSRLQGGTATASLEVSGTTTAPVITGPVRVVNTQLAGFDMGARLAAVQALMGAKTGADTTIQAIGADTKYGPDGTHLNNVAAIVSGVGTLSGNGFIGPAGALDFHLLVKLSSTGMGGLAGQAVNMLPGAFGSAVGQFTKNGIPLTISGTTSNPVFAPDLSGAIRSRNSNQNRQSNPLGKVLGGLLGR